MERANGVGPALREKALIRSAALRLQQGVAIPGLSGVDVEICRYDIVVARQHDRGAAHVKIGRVRRQTLQPSELVIELGAGLRVSVRRIDRGDKHTIDCRFEVAGFPVVRVAWQLETSRYRRPPRQDRHAVPALLTAVAHDSPPSGLLPLETQRRYT